MMDSNKLINDIIDMPDMDTADKVHMFIQLCDDEKLLAELSKQATLQKAEIVPESLVHCFTYGVLKITKPHLFLKGEVS